MRRGIRNSGQMGSWFSDFVDQTFHVDSQAAAASVAKAALALAAPAAAIPGFGWIAGGALAGIGGLIAVGQGGLNAGNAPVPTVAQPTPADLQKAINQVQGAPNPAPAIAVPGAQPNSSVLPLALGAASLFLLK